MKVELTPVQMLEYIIIGIKNGHYQAAMNLAQECVDQIKKKEDETEKESNATAEI